MKALTVDFELITQSMRDFSRLTNDYYLDRNSGKVLALSRTLINSLEKDTEERENLPEWDAKMIPLAREIVLTGSDRYLRVPEAFGCPEHKWMSEFLPQIQSFKLKSKLFQTLRGRGSCRRFKEILKNHDEEFEVWKSFVSHRWQERIQNWLESVGILAVGVAPKKARAGRK
jgi:hypothetical protein